MAPEEILDLFAKLKGRPPRAARTKQPPNLAQRNQLRMDIITDCLHRIVLMHPAFTIQLRKMTTKAKEKKTDWNAINSKSNYTNNCRTPNNSVTHHTNKPSVIQDSDLELQYVWNIDILHSMFKRSHLLHERCSAFWSSYIQEYTSRLVPVALLTTTTESFQWRS
jgi:hypothetical protein